MNPRTYNLILGWCPRLQYTGPGKNLPSYAFPASLSIMALVLSYWVYVGLTTIRVGLPLDSIPGGFFAYIIVYMVGLVFSRFTILFWRLRKVKIPVTDWSRFSKWVAFQIVAIPVGLAAGSTIYLCAGGWPSLSVFF